MPSVDDVQDLAPLVQYTASGGQTVFPYPFPIFGDDNLVVYDNDTLQTLTTDYTVSGAGNDTGGNVTFVTGRTADHVITIYRDVPMERLTDFSQNGPRRSADMNDELDRITMYVQQLKRDVGRCIRMSLRNPQASADLELDPISSWQERYLFVNSDGELEPAVNADAAALTQSTIGGLLFPQTGAEATAGVTPVNYAYPPLTIQRYDGNWSQWQSVAANTTAAGWQTFWSRRGPTSTALGEAALIAETASGNANTGFGYQALRANTDGSQNSAFGKACLEANTTGTDNTGAGFNSLKANTTGEKNCSFGSFNMTANIDGSFNAAFGQNCLTANTSGDENCAFGQGALFNNTTGSNNTAMGEHALLTNTTANDNTAVGSYALEDCTGANNVGVGRNAGLNISSGHENTAVGKDALQNLTTGIECTAVGHGALGANTGNGNTAVGQAALNVNSTGTANTACGHRALVNNTTGTGNTACGEDALVANTGDLNTAVGKNSLLGTTSGAGVTAIGHSAGATNTTGGTNTFIGYTADANAGNYSNTTALGNAAVCTGSNQITLGNSSIATLRCQQTTITALSDVRFKKNIRKLDIPDQALMELEVVVFEWIDEGMPPGPQVGFIAQALDAWQIKWQLGWLGLVDKTNPARWEATPHKLFFPLMLGVQRLAARVTALEGDDQWRAAMRDRGMT